jgi:exodeoxyribonuclease-5
MNREDIIKVFPYLPTEEQFGLFDSLDAFLRSEEENSGFLLKGYAGTGKTSVISAAIKLLGNYKMKPILLAPTGRAAKVFSSYSGLNAYTIHKKIYWPKGNAFSGGFSLANNLHTRTLFIVDEASMIAGSLTESSLGGSNRSLLDDLIEYVYNGKGCRILLMGDSAQLPPVGLEDSPALDAAFLEEKYGMQVYDFELSEVLRQSSKSGILENVTLIRNLLQKEKVGFRDIRLKAYADTQRIGGDTLEEEISNSYTRSGLENTLIICRSNKSANAYNQHIRNRVLGREDKINIGDVVMIVKNNYHWLPADFPMDFLANGDIARVKKLRNQEVMYGFEFADAVLELIDYEESPEFTCKVMLNTLFMESSSLSFAEMTRFQEAILKDYGPIKNKKLQWEKLRADPYWNALQIKYSYAVTCHKAQGGQWETVFVDQGYLKEEMLNKEFIRWLYTASTRAIGKLFLVNFSDKFF